MEVREALPPEGEGERERSWEGPAAVVEWERVGAEEGVRPVPLGEGERERVEQAVEQEVGEEVVVRVKQAEGEEVEDPPLGVFEMHREEEGVGEGGEEGLPVLSPLAKGDWEVVVETLEDPDSDTDPVMDRDWEGEPGGDTDKDWECVDARLPPLTTALGENTSVGGGGVEVEGDRDTVEVREMIEVKEGVGAPDPVPALAAPAPVPAPAPPP